MLGEIAVSEIPMRTCTKCGEMFPATTEFFNKARKGKYGLAPKCKKCCQQYYKENKERILGQQRQYRQTNKPIIAESRHQYYLRNKEKIVAKSKKYHWTNRQQVLERKREYYAENKVEIGMQRREWYKNQGWQKQRIYWGKNKIRLRVNNQLYRANHPERFRVNKIRRIARKFSLPDSLTNQQWLSCLHYFNGCCAVCGRQLKDLFGTHTASADHWIPLSYEGENNPGTVVTNIVPLCHGEDGCNNSKKNHMPDVWLTKRYGKRKANQILKRIEDYFDWVRANILVEESGQTIPLPL